MLLSPAVHRLVHRSLLLGDPNPQRNALYTRFFGMAIPFGEVLHDIREALEFWRFPLEPGLPTLEVVQSWEDGLLLPDDVFSPSIIALLRFYATHIMESDDECVAVLGLTSTMLYIELSHVLTPLHPSS